MVHFHFIPSQKTKYAKFCFVFATVFGAMYFPVCEGSEIPGNITCTNDQGCTTVVNNSVCVENTCHCPDIFPIFVNATNPENNSSDTTVMLFCLPKLNLSDAGCLFNQQCSYTHGYCDNGTCGCAKYYEIEHRINRCELEKPDLVVLVSVGGVLALLILSILAFYLCRRRYAK